MNITADDLTTLIDIARAAAPVAHERIRIEQRVPGYAHVTLSGSCDSDVTVEEIRELFYHPYFGGRCAWVRAGRFGVTVHTD